MDDYTNPRGGASSPDPHDSTSTAPGEARMPVIESASATTSRDNHAGATPLIITACTLALALALGYGLIACLGSAARLALNAYESKATSSRSYELSDPGDLDDFDDLDDLLEDLLGNSGSSVQRRGRTSINAGFNTPRAS